MKKKVKLRAYAAANLGDDLFIELICKRYPNNEFFLCGSKKFNKVYKKIPNLEYKCWDSICFRIYSLVYRLLMKSFVWKFKKGSIQYTTDELLNNRYALKAEINVYITGSGFMNSPDEFDSLTDKYNRELNYYKLHPYVIGCNFGPFAHKEYLEMYRKLFSYASDVCFRDNHSLQLFPNLNCARRAADIVFNYPIEAVQNQRRLVENEYMLVSVANLKKDNDDASDFFEDYIEFIKRIVCERNRQKKYTVLVGFSREQKDDNTILSILKDIDSCPYIYSFCYPDISSSEVVSLFRDATSIIATRYHAMILALLFEKPACSVCYNEKTQHVLEDIYMQDSGISLADMKRLDYETLIREKMHEINKQHLKNLIESAKLQFEQLDKVL